MADQPFMMPVEDVFMVAGRGLKASGRVETGTIRPGDTVEVVGRRATVSFVVIGIEAIRRELGQARAGDSVLLLLRGATPSDIAHGDVLATPGTILAHARFSADIHFLSKEEGGRHTPMFEGYRPEFRFHDQGFGGLLQFPEGTEMIWPGEDVRTEVTLADRTAMNIGQRFTVHERTGKVGAGVVVALLD